MNTTDKNPRYIPSIRSLWHCSFYLECSPQIIYLSHSFLLYFSPRKLLSSDKPFFSFHFSVSSLFPSLSFLLCVYTAFCFFLSFSFFFVPPTVPFFLSVSLSALPFIDSHTRMYAPQRQFQVFLVPGTGGAEQVLIQWALYLPKFWWSEGKTVSVSKSELFLLLCSTSIFIHLSWSMFLQHMQRLKS